MAVQAKPSGAKFLSKASPKSIDQVAIEFNCHDLAARFQQLGCQGACAGPDFTDEVAGLQNGQIDDASDVSGVGQKVLTQGLLGAIGSFQNGAYVSINVDVTGFSWRCFNMSELVREVTDDSFEQDVLKADQPVLVDFWAAWCAPCRMLAPTIEQIAQDFEGKARVVKLDVDDNAATSARFNIRGIPTLLLFKDGEVKDQVVGATSRESIARMINNQL